MAETVVSYGTKGLSLDKKVKYDDDARRKFYEDKNELGATIIH